jgi:hypothetical protein
VKKILFWMGFVLAAAVASVPLALVSEGYGYRFFLQTPGMAVAERQAPINPTGSGLMVLSKRMDIQLPIDAAFWLLVICVVGIAVSLWRRHKRTSLHAAKS